MELAPAAETGHITMRCPRCETRLDVPLAVRALCGQCQLELRVDRFQPPPRDSHAAAPALPDEATCAHHPAKRAEAVCAGSGDYICKLCTVELEGDTYSAHYLEAGGKQKLKHAFDRSLPRPDRAAALLLVLAVPFWIFAFVLLPVAFYYIFRIDSIGKSNPLYKEIVGFRQLFLLTLITIGSVGLNLFLWVGILVL